MGELASLGAAAVWASASLIFARLGLRASALALNALKCTLALALLWLTLGIVDGEWWPAATSSQIWILGISAAVGLSIGDTLYFQALARMGPRRTLLITASVPPMTAVLGVFVLSEPITISMAVGLLLTLAGIVWVIRERAPEGMSEGQPSPSELRVGILLALGFSLAQAVGNVLTKLGGEGLSSLAVSVVRLSVGAAGLLVFVAVTRKGAELIRPLTSAGTASMVVAGTLLGTYAGIWLMMYGLQNAEVGVAATLAATSPILVLPLVALVDGEKISARAAVGALIAVAGVAVLCLG